MYARAESWTEGYPEAHKQRPPHAPTPRQVLLGIDGKLKTFLSVLRENALLKTGNSSRNWETNHSNQREFMQYLRQKKYKTKETLLVYEEV